jgi:outer membrane protein OmpA-like peptidoglycan-associated protein
VIHDTIVKEVIKEKVDTLFITKTDTVSYVDSTTVTTVEMVKLPNVQFYTDADVLLPSSAKELQKLAQYLTDNRNLKATIIGHTDNTGDPQANLSLSKRRAESVLNFLTQLGVKKNRLTSIGMGDRNPIGDNEKEEGRLMNRRVEVRLTEIGKIETKRSNKE